jgi:hypothetical protein
MTAETTDWVGLTLDGRYSVTAKLGEGGMGFVYRARDARLGWDVVIKVPRAAMLEEAGFRERFRAEVGALVRLAHPHVVKVTDFGQHDGVPFAVMQFLPGGSLEDRRPRDDAGKPKPVSPRTLAEWLPAVADALDFIHKQGYVHRDVKPANILFDAHKNAYISDFGVAKAVAGGPTERPGLTGAGRVLGTPTHMAPEMVLGEPFDGRVDQYALAVTVFEMLAAKLPFEGPTAMAVLIKRTTDSPPALAEVRPTIPAALSAAVARAMSKDPGQRFPSCAAFAKAAVEVSRGTHDVGRRQPPGSSKIQGGHAPRTPKSGETPRSGIVPTVVVPPALPARAAGRNRTLIVALAGTAMVITGLAGVVIWLAVRGGKDDRASRERSQPEVASRPGTPANVRTAEKNQETDASHSPSPVRDLRPSTAAIDLLAGGPWEPFQVAIERSGPARVTVELTPPLGVEVRPPSVVVESAEPARFELRAAAGAVPQTGMAVELAVAGSSLRRSVPIRLRRLDFQISLTAAGEVSATAGQEKVIFLRIDRAGGYVGPLTVAVATSPVVQAGRVDVPARATAVTVPLTIAATARPGPITIRVTASAADGGPSHELPVVVRVAAVSEERSFAGHAGRVESVSISGDAVLAVTGGADGTVRLWDMTTGQEKWKGEGYAGPVLSVAFSADATHVISGGADRTVRVWDVSTGAGRAFEKHHDTAVWLVRFEDARHARSVSADKTIHWVVGTGQPRKVPDGKRDLVLGQKYKLDITAGDELKATTRIPTDTGEVSVAGIGSTNVTVHEKPANAKAQPRLLHVVAGQGAAPVKLLAVSRTGGRLLAVGEDNAVRLWDLSPPRTMRLLAGFPWAPDNEVTCAALTPDGRQVLLGGADGVLRLWRLP